MLTEKAIEGYKVYTERTISYARYRLGSTWHTAQISRKERMKDGRVAVYFPIIPQTTEEVTITTVQLYDKSDCRALGGKGRGHQNRKCAGGRPLPLHIRPARR